MARRRRLTPAQPGYTATYDAPAGPAAGLATPGLPGQGATPPVGAPRPAPIAQVSGQSAAAAALREVTEGIQAARDEGRMVVDVPLTDISPGHLLRDRVMLNREDLDALKASIQAHGQRVPAEITPLSGADQSQGDAVGGPVYRFGLISGWRRLSALNELHAETGDARFSTLRALIRPDRDAVNAYVAMVEENEIRIGLSYFERARVVAELTKRGVFPDQATALRTLFAAASRAKRSKIGSFIEIYEALGDVLRFPADIPERLGLALVSGLRQGRKPEIRKAVSKAVVGTATAELALLERLAVPARPTTVSRAKHDAEVLAPGVTLQTKRHGTAMTLTLAGDGVNEQVLEAVRKAVAQLR